MYQIRRTHLTFLILTFVVLLTAVALTPAPVAAGLPPRPDDPTPTPEPTLPDTIDNSGGVIILHVASPPTGLQTIVQWQDGLGEWHDVTGWQGTLNAANFIAWWVAPEHLGKGPFRWVVSNEEIWEASDPFNTPGAGSTSHLFIALPQ